MCTKVSQGMTVAWEGMKHHASRAGNWMSETGHKVAEWAKPKWASMKEATFNAYTSTKNWFVTHQGKIIPAVIAAAITALVIFVAYKFCCSKEKDAAAPAAGAQPAPAAAPAAAAPAAAPAAPAAGAQAAPQQRVA